MSSAKPKPKKKTKGFLDQEKYTAELTSWQLVSGVIILIVFGTACFALGVLVGKFEPTPRPTYAEGTEQADRPSEPAKEPAKQTAKNMKAGEGTQQSPRRFDQATAQAPPATDSTAGVTRPTGDTPTKLTPGGAGPRLVTLPDPPVESPTVSAQPAEAPSTEGATVTAEVDAPAGNDPMRVLEPEVTSAPAPQTSWAPVEPVTEPTQPKPETTVPDPAPSNTPVSALGAKSTGGSYTLQLVALSDRAKAERFGEELEKRTGLPVELSTKGKLVIVTAGQFPDRAAAESVRATLRGVKAYQDCLVTQRK